MSSFGFRLMALTFMVHDFIRPRMDILKEVDIKPGHAALDYGCGSGSYIVPLVELVGKEGRIYALDINPTAIQMVNKIALQKHLINLKTIQSDCQTNLPANCIDVVLLYDILHDLADPDRVLQELHRVLKANGILSVRDHHMAEPEIISRVTNAGLFSFLKKGKSTYFFTKGT
jgi:ubiquinone/menaquinone biosynthesis C-methylase UbiE